MTTMLDLSWAANLRHDDAPMLATLDDADLVAAADDADDTGSLHFDHCPDAPEQVRVRVTLPWTVLLPLLNTEPLASCWCADADNTSLPPLVRAIATAHGVEHSVREASAHPNHPGALARLVEETAQLIASTTKATASRWYTASPFVPELTALAQRARTTLGFADDHTASDTLGPDAFAYARMVAAQPTGLLRAPEGADDGALTAWAQGVFADSSWVDATYVTSISGRYLTRMWVPADVSRVLVRIPNQVLDKTLAGRHVVSTDPDADPSTLPPASR